MKHKGTAIAMAVLLFVTVAFPAQRKQLHFEITVMGAVIDEAATEAGFHTQRWSDCHLAVTSFKSSNGQGASVRSAYFETSDEATQYFEWSLRRATKVIEQADQTDRNGKRVGRRAVVLVNPNQWVVMWTNAATVLSFASSELSVARELEKQYGPRASTRTAR